VEHNEICEGVDWMNLFQDRNMTDCC
jgi:hypothetical protein